MRTSFLERTENAVVQALLNPLFCLRQLPHGMRMSRGIRFVWAVTERRWESRSDHFWRRRLQEHKEITHP